MNKWSKVRTLEDKPRSGCLEPSLHDRPREIWPSETEYKFSFKTNMAENTWKDDEFLLSFKFSRVQISRKGFYELF